ncbi:MAG: PqqD family protein [Gemmatimonadetes bacterium]|nr:MAG: PqqD family protein [Gemmatimonadota bacterium]
MSPLARPARLFSTRRAWRHLAGRRGSQHVSGPPGAAHGVDSVTLTSVVAPARDQVSCDLAGEAAILHLGSGIYYGLNPVGARIWALLQQPIRVDHLRDTLLAEYDIAPERLERDLTGLLQQLAAERLIEVRHDAVA